MIHIKMTCDARRTKLDGTSLIVFRITVNKQSRDIPSGFSCKSSEWDYKMNSLRCKTKALKVMAERLADKELELLQRIRKYEREHPLDSVQEVKDFLCNRKQNASTVKEFWLAEIERMHRAQRHSNALNYHSALLGVDKTTNLQIPFEKINYNWLLEVETRMRERGVTTVSIGVYYRALRAVYNKAINMGIVEQGLYPFRRYKIKSGTTSPRNLSLDEMRRFYQYKPTCEKTEFAHDIGMLIFYLRGMNFTDLALLSCDCIKNNRIVYERSKTHKMYSVAILPQATEVFKKYKSEINDLVLNILTADDLNNKVRLPDVIKQHRKVLNKWLKRIGTTLGINERLSTYVFRYTHANLCRELGYTKDMISSSLGHATGIRVTDAYLHDFDSSLIDKMNEAVVEAVIGK